MSSEPHLDVNIEHRLGSLALNICFETCAPWTLLFGASGSGKSTILRAIAGMVRPDRGRIALRAQPVFDSATNFYLAAHMRPVRWSAQRASLFPHLTVAQNLAFAVAPIPGLSRAQKKSAVADALAHFRLEALGRHYPAQLSGGEQQRVALARGAIGARGKLLLLDEPFTGLDAPVRDDLIANLRAFLGQTPVLSVTHSVAEALMLDARVLRLEHGSITRYGPAAEVLAPEIQRLRATLDGAVPPRLDAGTAPSATTAPTRV